MITRNDFEAISHWIKPGACVLDLGGGGELLVYLEQSQNIIGYSILNDEVGILACIANGVNVIQSNLESGLKEVGDGAFDYVILSQTLQAMKRTEAVVGEMLRVGREAIVSFPNLIKGARLDFFTARALPVHPIRLHRHCPPASVVLSVSTRAARP